MVTPLMLGLRKHHKPFIPLAPKKSIWYTLEALLKDQSARMGPMKSGLVTELAGYAPDAPDVSVSVVPPTPALIIFTPRTITL